MQLVDIGANLGHEAFRDDRAGVIARAAGSGVAFIIVTGTSIRESEEAISIAKTNPNLYATAGVHPHHARECDERTIPQLRELARHPRVVAIGECGLDFNRNYSPHPDQEKWFEEQIRLSFELGKPLFLHSRDAHPRFAEILKANKVEHAVAHCFTGEKAELSSYLDLGLYIGITGWICDERRGTHLLELVREIPRDRLLLETDAPYLTPRSLRPQPRARRNEPAFLPHILHTVARALGRPAGEVAAETTQNAFRLFRLNESGSATAAQRPLAA
ncbi:MAG TPA: TatD family hydrolase [Burkholderiales bacterium]|jgi:TatD DNase family protein|nr:TatD family hydrolase [Burkholderiales bacterium]